MRKRGLCCGPVSIRLSRSCILSRRLKISSNFFVSPFFDPSAGTQFQGEPLQRGRKVEGGGKILQFSTDESRKEEETLFAE